jgi:hypothetical protein
MQVGVTGMVEIFAEIRPERVIFRGKPGKIAHTDVMIIPRKEYPFTIGTLKAKNGEFFNCELIESVTDGKNQYIIRIKNTRTKKGRYADVLKVTTDSNLRPTILIYIIGVIQ